MHAATIDAANWWARPRAQTNPTWISSYQNSLASRHRDVIVGIVSGLEATSVLEVGCHCGPNLMRLAQACPSLEQLVGVDVNAEAVTAGTRWAADLGLSDRVELSVGRVPDKTDALPDGCVDVVLSCYALAYIAPPDLDAVLYEMGRLARRAVIVAEPMTDGAQSAQKISWSDYKEWAHNYRDASRWIGTWGGMTLTTHSVTPPVDRLHEILVGVRAG